MSSSLYPENEIDELIENPEPEADTDFALNRTEDEFHLNSQAEDELHFNNSAQNELVATINSDQVNIEEPSTTRREVDNEIEAEDEIHINNSAQNEQNSDINTESSNVAENSANSRRVVNELEDDDQTESNRNGEILNEDEAFASNTSEQGNSNGLLDETDEADTVEPAEADICVDFEAPEDELCNEAPEADLCEGGALQLLDSELSIASLEKPSELADGHENQEEEVAPEGVVKSIDLPLVLKLTKSESVESYEPECDQESSAAVQASGEYDTSVTTDQVTAESHASSTADRECQNIQNGHQSKVSDGFQNLSYENVNNTVTVESQDNVESDFELSNARNESSLENPCVLNEESSVTNSFSSQNESINNNVQLIHNLPSEKENILTSESTSDQNIDSLVEQELPLRRESNLTPEKSDMKLHKCVSPISDDDLLSELDSELGVSVKGEAKNENQVTDAKSSSNSEVATTILQPEESQQDSSSSLTLTCDYSDEVINKDENISEEAWVIIQDLQQKLTKTRQQLQRQERHLQKSNEENSNLHKQLETVTEQRDTYFKEVEIIKKHNSDDLYIPQIKELENTISQQQKEINGLRDKLSSHDAAAKRAITALQGEIKQRTDQMTKAYKEAVADKDQMVVKYAQAEKNNLSSLKNIERLESKIKDAAKEKESLLGKIKDLKLEKTRLGHELDLKSNEALGLKKEAEKFKDQVSSSDVRIKWAQNKLKAELDGHKETKANLEKTNQRLKEAKEETEQIRRNCQEIIKTYQESEEIKSNSLDQQLKKKETELLLQETENKDKEELYSTTIKELEHLKIKHRETLAELHTYQDKTQCLEEEHKRDEDTMNKFKHMLQKQKTENKDLQDKLEQMVQLQTDFKNAQRTIKSLDEEISNLKINNKDLSIEMEGCRKREAEKLELTEKLSAKNAELQSENSALNDRVMALSVEVQSIRMDLQSKETNLDELTRKLSEETTKNQQEIKQLTEKLQEKSKKVDELSTRIGDEKDEIKTLKRKHVNSIKDLTRQLQQARRRLENYEANGDKESNSLGSRTSSTNSLNTLANGDGQNHSVTQVPPHTYRQCSPPEPEYPVITEQVEPDRQMLIERIVKLQKMLARRNEKIEFIEEHTHQLVDDIQKKNRIIQMYALREDSGTLTAEAADASKAQIARKHSIMGSVFSSHQTDGTMTLDLSLEINRKLQAVLEDTILKNMTLKESLDTLGEEISRLSQENRKMQLKLEHQSR